MAYFQVNDRCTGCLACVQNCPASALDYRDEGPQRTLLHSMTRCARCGTCWRVCPRDAIEFQYLLKNRWDEVATLELVRCRVCGEPVHTTRLADAVDDRLEPLAEDLCARHRVQRASLAVAYALAAGRGLKRGKAS